MATLAQKAANRANSQKSCGPKTPEGKAKSRLNALSHGFEAATRFIPGENPDDAYDLLAALNHEYHPATPTEQILVEKMFHNQWLSLRAIRLQSNALRFRMEPNTGETPHDLGLLIRYQTAADRAFHRAHAELVKAQKERKNSEIGFVPENAEEPVPDAAPQQENTAPAEQIIDPPAESTSETTSIPPYVLQILQEQAVFEAELAEMMGVSVEDLTRAA